MMLRQCPFCGGDAHVVCHVGRNVTYVQCSDCGCRTPDAYTSTRKQCKSVFSISANNVDAAREAIAKIWNERV